MNQDSSDDEEDVFSCGRCKEHFSSMGSFMEHKTSQMCRKAKQQRPVENQQHETTPSLPSSLAGIQKVPDSIAGTSQKATPSSTSHVTALHQVPTFSEQDNLQSSVARLQDVLASLQGGQQVEQLDFSSGVSESQDGQALIHVFEKLLGSPSRDVPLNTTRPGPGTTQVLDSYIDGNNTENLTSQMSSSKFCNVQTVPRSNCTARQTASEVPPQDELVMREQPRSPHGDSGPGQASAVLGQDPVKEESINRAAGVVHGIEGLATRKQRSRRQPALQLDAQPSLKYPNKSTKVTGRKESNTAQTELQTDSGHLLEIPEAFKNTQSVECKFCSEILKNADSLFSHFVDIHKMKGGAAFEFFRQFVFKRKRGRPPKGLTGNCKPVFCPHCSVSFKNKTMCAAHVRKHHRDTTAVMSNSKAQDLPSGRRRKCARCTFQTTTAKDLTAHIHSCHSNRAQLVDEALEKHTKEESNSTNKTKSKDTPKMLRGRKRTRDVQEDAVNIEQDDDDDVDDEDEDEDSDEMGEEQGKNNAPLKGQVTCPECNKKMDARGLKRHQVRCANKNRFVCLLCQHKSRESYDHVVHVDNHRTWVKAQSCWINHLKGSDPKPAAAVTSEATAATSVASVDGTSPLLLVDSNSMIVDGDKVQYASTVDLEELALITQIQGENELLRQNKQVMASGDSRDTEKGLLQTSDVSNVSSRPQVQDGDTREIGTPSTEQELKPVDGEEKKLNPRDLKCKICYTWFGRTNFPKHMLQTHSMVKRFQCRDKTCKAVFAKLEDFKTHIISCHSTESMFRCGCRGCVNHRLITPEKMDNIRKEKMRDYYKHMSHKCSKCWVKFPSQGSLDRHMKKESHHHPCSMCSKIQVSKRQLRMHMVTHQAERAYLCEVCGQDFKTKRDLNKHYFSHSNIRPYQCPECAKCFSFKNKMTRHMVTVHTAKKPFACEWPDCNRAFSRKDKLNDHTKTHLVSFPFTCQYCNKGFYRKDNLKDHEILHTREFRFRCAVCNRGFLRPKILERHCLTEHSTITSQVTLQATTATQDGQTDSPNRSVTDHQSISYVFCEPYVYANIDQLTSFQDNVQETEVQLMQGQRATIEAIQNAAAAVLGNGQNQFEIEEADAFPVITLGT